MVPTETNSGHLVSVSLTMTSSNGTIFHVTDPLWGESTRHRLFPSQKPVTRNFDIFFRLHLNKRCNKQNIGDLRRHRAHYDVIVMLRRCYSTCSSCGKTWYVIVHHWGWIRMGGILHTIFSNAFSWMDLSVCVIGISLFEILFTGI